MESSQLDCHRSMFSCGHTTPNAGQWQKMLASSSGYGVYKAVMGGIYAVPSDIVDSSLSLLSSHA
jgi:hypothetical protein